MVLRSCLYERRDGSKKSGVVGGGGGRLKKREKKRLFSFLYRTDIGLLD